MDLQTLIQTIVPLDQPAMDAALRRQAELAKPPGSLGRLESLSVQIAGITGKLDNQIHDNALLVFAADNGVVAEGVSSAPQSVTLQQTVNLTRAKTGASVLAQHFGDRVIVCDVGVNADIRESAVLNRKIAYGTCNIAHGPAMTRQQALQAIMTGAQLAMETPADALGIGEMGIGNTTTSSAVAAALLGRSAGEVTGRGAGLSDRGLERKIAVIDSALALHRPDPVDPVDVLAKVGGYDIAAMAGFYLGCARYRIPAVMDGFISTVAALAAVRLCPAAGDALVASHLSAEPGAGFVMEALGQPPLLCLGMALGEGTGAVSAMPLLDMALRVYFDMPSFDGIGIEAYRPL